MEFLRLLDCFGVPYTFKYKAKEKYTTSLGGIITILFIAISLFLAIYNFIPFYNKKNFTTIYYILKLPETEQVFFDKSKMAFSIGLNCWTGSDGTKANDLFDVYYKYIYWDVQNGEYKRKIENIKTHQCTYSDFFNSFNKQFEDSKVFNYQCLDDLSRSIEGIYASPVFSYYEFNVNAKNDSKELLDKIENYLIENDCKLQIYYIDTTIDIDDYKDPIKSYLETDFIQLNPTLSIRRNMYFMNQHLYDDDSFISLLNSPEDEESQLSSLYSRYEEYSLYQGLNRTNSSSDHLNWAKLFFRADTRKTDVKRKYQNIMEFYADATSLLIGFYEILIIIFNFINNFYAELSLSKKIFFFKETNHNNLNLNKYSKRINELILKTNPNAKPSVFHNNFFPRRRNNNPDSNVFSDNINNNNNDKDNEKNSGKSSSKKSISNIELLSINKFDIKSISNDRSIDKLQSNNLQTDNISFKQGSKKNIYKKNEVKTYNKNKEKEKEKAKETESISAENYQDIKYNFNVFEIIIASTCKCCLWKNLKIKRQINKKAVHILYNSLDIVCFVRNQMLFNIINETILADHIKSIINFLCRPIVSINDNKNKKELDFYKIYKEDDFNKFSEELIELVKKPKKKEKEKKLILLSNIHLKDFLMNNS